MADQIERGFPDFKNGVRWGIHLVTLAYTRGTGTPLNQSLNLAKRDIKQIKDIAKKYKIDVRDFGDYVEEMKHLEGRKGSDHVSWSQLEKWAKEFKELFGGD